MKSKSMIRNFSLITLSLFLVSCGDDPELIKKREQQKQEIERLKGEIAIKEEMISSLPPDRTKELQAAQEKAEVQTKEVEKMEEEIALLEKKKRILEKEVEDYKKKYPVVR